MAQLRACSVERSSMDAMSCSTTVSFTREERRISACSSSSLQSMGRLKSAPASYKAQPGHRACSASRYPTDQAGSTPVRHPAGSRFASSASAAGSWPSLWSRVGTGQGGGANRALA